MNDNEFFLARKARIAFIKNMMIPYFKAQSRDELCKMRPVWDNNPASLAYNLQNRAFFPHGFSVFDAPLAAILPLVHPDFAWTLDVLFPSQREEGKIAEALTNWSEGTALTPPIFQPLGTQIAINDGMHRTAAAAFLRVERIKFYARREHEAWFLENVPGAQLLWRGVWP